MELILNHTAAYYTLHNSLKSVLAVTKCVKLASSLSSTDYETSSSSSWKKVISMVVIELIVNFR